MSFASIKGQNDAVSFLKASLKNDRLSSAYLFCGSKGIGKMLTAMNFAKALTCQSKASVEGCDECLSCKKIDNLTHPDVLVMRPEEGKGIKINEIRQIIKDVYLKPFEAKRKVYIIEEAEDMKHEAANALLKVLEEPPVASVIILLTDNLKALFHTIVSRSQVVRFYPLKAEEIREILISGHGMDKDKAYLLSRLVSGRIGEAVRYKEEDVFHKRTMLIDSVCRIPAAGLSFDDVPKEKLKLYLDILLGWFRDILSRKAGADDPMLINIDKKDMISSQAHALSFGYLEGVIKEIIMTIAFLGRNANPKLAMSVLAFKIAKRA